ncbi:hypothetical protein LEP1GSC017_0741 [Leptospira meyeri serovar Hardjo str. Went 5]|nr:hypothetical protein LEP1GSC017_0741 [Leptospira meyeri serovar Hardjo str. Went 5]
MGGRRVKDSGFDSYPFGKLLTFTQKLASKIVIQMGNYLKITTQ